MVSPVAGNIPVFFLADTMMSVNRSVLCYGPDNYGGDDIQCLGRCPWTTHEDPPGGIRDACSSNYGLNVQPRLYIYVYI